MYFVLQLSDFLKLNGMWYSSFYLSGWFCVHLDFSGVNIHQQHLECLLHIVVSSSKFLWQCIKWEMTFLFADYSEADMECLAYLDLLQQAGVLKQIKSCDVSANPIPACHILMFFQAHFLSYPHVWGSLLEPIAQTWLFAATILFKAQRLLPCVSYHRTQSA